LKGSISFVLPSFENVKYIKHDVGETFGLIEIFGSMIDMNLQFNDWNKHVGALDRQFTIITTEDSEAMSFSLNNLEKFELEFND
jgi:hypothetical protein